MVSGKEIKIARILANMKAVELAKEVGISFSKLSLIENERVACSEDLYEKICKALKVEN